ncbi:2TM domain-containing protein [Deminuibacter soli]|nr:2TM domain-containing protein [Deminuibacter soli]
MQTQQQDDRLWKVAKKRAAFKIALTVYVLVNALEVAVWYFTTGPYGYFWPIWSMLGWGLGIAMQYVQAYHGNTLFSTEEEYKRLVEQEDKQL